jgi:hypothetical protein
MFMLRGYSPPRFDRRPNTWKLVATARGCSPPDVLRQGKTENSDRVRNTRKRVATVSKMASNMVKIRSLPGLEFEVPTRREYIAGSIQLPHGLTRKITSP